jgi:hypothetical protein
MEIITELIVNNYVLILTITIILIFALIGYIYDSKKEESILRKSESELDEEAIQNIVIPDGKSLKDSVSVSKNINPETNSVELVDQSILSDDQKLE